MATAPSGRKILQQIEYIQKYDRAFAVQGLIFRDNIYELLTTFDWCLNQKIDFSLNDILPIGRAKKNQQLLLQEEQIPILMELERKKLFYHQKFTPQNFSYPVANPNIYQSIANIVRQTGRPEPGLFVAYVSSDGFLYPDNYYAAENHKSAYNLRTTPLNNAWIKAFQTERNIKTNQFGDCKNCLIWQQGGTCDLQNTALSKSIYQQKKYCGVYPVLKKIKIQRMNP